MIIQKLEKSKGTITDHNIKMLDIKTKKIANNIFLGNYKTAFKGSGIEFADIREYENGDSFKSIDWKTSAKKGKLYIKKYIEERQLTIMFLVDIAQTMEFGTTSQTKKQTLLEILYLLGYSALQNNDKIGAILYDQQILKNTKPTKNKANLIKIINSINTTNTTTDYSDTIKAIQYINKIKYKNTLFFILTDDISLSQDNKKIYKLASIKNEIVYINIFDTFENTLQTQSKYKNIEITNKHKILNITLPNSKQIQKYISQRQEQNTEFQKYLNSIGIDYIQITQDTNIFKKLLSYFQSK